MDRGEQPRYQRMVQELRAAGIRAEMYLGESGMRAQMKYADKRGAVCVVLNPAMTIKKCVCENSGIILDFSHPHCNHRLRQVLRQRSVAELHH